jgi:hypothetical protein
VVTTELPCSDREHLINIWVSRWHIGQFIALLADIDNMYRFIDLLKFSGDR